MAIPRRPHNSGRIIAVQRTRLLGSGSTRRRRRSFGRSRGGRQAGIKPAGVDAPVEGLLRFGVDVALADQTAESRLNMGTGAAKAVVQIEMTESRIQIVPPKQANHAAAEPDAFRVTGRAGKHAGGFRDLVDLLLAVFGAFFSRRLLVRRGSGCAAALAQRRAGGHTENQRAKRTREPTPRHKRHRPAGLADCPTARSPLVAT